MNEEDVKKLLLKSKIETSKDFTDELMNRIDLETQPSVEKTLGISFKKILILCGCLLLIIGFLTFQLVGPKISLALFQGKNMATPLMILVFGTVLYSLNNFIRTMELSLKY